MKPGKFLILCTLGFALSLHARAQHTHAESSPAPAAKTAAPNAASAQLGAEALKTLAVAMSNVAAVLANDDLAAYGALQPTVRGAFHDLADVDAGLAKSLSEDLADPLPLRSNLDDARKGFGRFSTAVADAMRERKLVRAANLRLFECQMAPEIGTGRWLQSGAGAKNPFFGAAMLTCGTELDRPVAKGLPPGHPPIGHLTDAEKARYSGPNATKPANDAGCGSCGMSKAAMAAGEPCEHDHKK